MGIATAGLTEELAPVLASETGTEGSPLQGQVGEEVSWRIPSLWLGN